MYVTLNKRNTLCDFKLSKITTRPQMKIYKHQLKWALNEIHTYNDTTRAWTLDAWFDHTND